MKKCLHSRLFVHSIGVALLLMLGGQARAQLPPRFDWDRTLQLLQKYHRKEPLTPDEQAFLAEARKTSIPGAGRRPVPGHPRIQPDELHSLQPLTELGEMKYRGEEGGLYGGGLNEPSRELEAVVEIETKKIRPLDADGHTADSGKVVLLSLGMVNAAMEFGQFKTLADPDPAKAKNLVIVNGALEGYDAVRVTDPAADYWEKVDAQLRNVGVTPKQVQVVWLKQAIAGPMMGFPAETLRLEELLIKTLNIARERYPNLRIAYLANRTYAGYAISRLNPEPYAYESAFAIRWLIQEQNLGRPELNFDAAKGEVKAPLVLWGPYMWAAGAQAGKADGLTWLKSDSATDGVRPSPTGTFKIAGLLLKFFKTDPNTRKWFLQPS